MKFVIFLLLFLCACFGSCLLVSTSEAGVFNAATAGVDINSPAAIAENITLPDDGFQDRENAEASSCVLLRGVRRLGGRIRGVLGGCSLHFDSQ